MLGGESNQVAVAQPVVLVRELDLLGAEFAAFGSEVLCAGVEPVDLDVRGVGDQGNIVNVAGLG